MKDKTESIPSKSGLAAYVLATLSDRLIRRNNAVLSQQVFDGTNT